MDKARDYDAYFYVTGTPYLMGFLCLFLLHCFGKKTVMNNIELEMGTTNDAS